jgi:SpoVK/Ycf46/Vps4 family AAA+-type ATPase
MQEKTAPVFVVATANRIEALPPELLRKGRFDEIFFVDLPTEDARKEILSIHLARKKRSPSQFDLKRLAQESLGFSGAELEEAVREALFESFAEGKEVTTEHIARAIKATYPLSRTMRDQITQLREWSRARARRASSQEPEPLPQDVGQAVPVLRQEQRNPFVPKGTLGGTEDRGERRT